MFVIGQHILYSKNDIYIGEHMFFIAASNMQQLSNLTK